MGNKGASDVLKTSMAMNEGLNLTGRLGLTDKQEIAYFVLALGSRFFQETDYKHQQMLGDLPLVGRLLPRFISRDLESAAVREQQSRKIFEDFRRKVREGLSGQVGEARVTDMDKAAQDLVSTGLRQMEGVKKRRGLKNVDLQLSEEDMDRWSERWKERLQKSDS
jgi:hypothetical protein